MKTVVGAAVIRHGCVLAARRTSPPATAGRWEFPGGKVEPGESPGTALVREITEELGCTIEIDRWLDGVVPIGERHALRVATARIVHGEPTPTEHDSLRWLTPEQIGDVDWLEPDRPFLPELRERLLDGEALVGGNVGGACRIGDTVRRPTGPWTPAVHRLLNHLADSDLTAVPRVQGIDARGREVIEHLAGEVIDVDTALLSAPRLASLARWARHFHDVVEAHHDEGPWRFFGVDEPQLIAHNDLTPYNVCFEGDEVSGVFDWDLAGPSTRLMELAHLAWSGIPLFRPISADIAARRLAILATNYAGPTALEILDAVPTRVQVAIDGIRRAAQSGDDGMRRLMASGEPERTEQRLSDLRTRLADIVEILES